MLNEFELAALKGELTSIHRIADMGLAALAHAEHLQEQLDGADESLASDSLRAHAAEQFVEKMADLAEQRNAERAAKIAELEERIASHVCAGPTTINLTENAAVQEFTAELRRELAEERNHVRQYKATIEAQGQSIESLREQIYQAQQDAAKSVAPGSAEWQRQVTAKFYKARKVLFGWAERAKKNPSGVISLVSLDFESLVRELTSPERPGGDASETPAPDCEQLKADFMSARDSVAERLGRVKELLQTGPYDQVGREIEEALKELAGVAF